MGEKIRPAETNPLIRGLAEELPAYGEIRASHVLPALRQLLAENRQRLRQLTNAGEPTWEHFMQPLEEMEERLQRVWGPVSHLNAVCDSDDLRAAHQEGQQLVASYQTDLNQNEAVFSSLKRLRDGSSFAQLEADRKQVVEHALRDFRLSGAELDDAAKKRFKTIQLRLAELSTLFDQHLLDATRAYELHICEEADLAGIPASVAEAGRQRAGESGKSGWLFTLDAPSYLPFMQYAENRDLRRAMYTAYVTRASDGALDNSPLIKEILRLRNEAAELLGFASYAELSLTPKMAASVEEVCVFLRDLAKRSRSKAEAELADLTMFARTRLGIAQPQAWDMAFVSERLRGQRFGYSQEDLKPYFPEPQVISGLFTLANRLYGLNIRRRDGAPCWHSNVRYFDIFDRDERLIAGFYLDPYARPHKRGGAWMDECIVRWRRPEGRLQLPVAYLVCNFDAPTGKAPALWTHEEVITLFHEFGHGLHHMLTEVEALGVSGIRGVPWDAVELPSQFMENYCWERDMLALFARHYRTGQRLPDTLFAKMREARDFQSGMQMLRQIELALFDILLHSAYEPDGASSVQDVLDAVRREVAVIVPPSFNRFQNSFSHIFAGGYAAGYFSYKWAEVLSADAFSAFEEAGIFDAETASALRNHVLAVGGSRDIMDAFVAFRGRKPEIDALLRQSGIAAKLS